MDDSRNQPELETLSYKPPGANPEPASAPQETLGFNSHVIKPETRINKVKDAGQPLEQPKCQLNKASCTKVTEQPNQNLMIIEEIEGLLSQANEKMYELPIHQMRSKAIEEIDLLRKVTIKTELRKAFE